MNNEPKGMNAFTQGNPVPVVLPLIAHCSLFIVH
jgi:hypothetical protein